MAQAIVLTGGVSHPSGRAVPVLSDLLAAAVWAAGGSDQPLGTM